MNLRCGALALALVVMICAATEASGAPTTLKNDTYTGGSISAGLQNGFSAGESFAALFTPPSYPFTVNKIQALIADKTAGSVNSKEYTLLIYQDTPGSKAPGAKLLDLATYLTPSQSKLQEIDVTKHNIVITKGDIRVQFRQLHTGAPSIVRDNGPRKAKRNLIHGKIGGPMAWHWVEDLTKVGMNIKGNWIIRVVSGSGGTPPPREAPRPATAPRPPWTAPPPRLTRGPWAAWAPRGSPATPTAPATPGSPACPSSAWSRPNRTTAARWAAPPAPPLPPRRCCCRCCSSPADAAAKTPPPSQPPHELRLQRHRTVERRLDELQHLPAALGELAPQRQVVAGVVA